LRLSWATIEEHRKQGSDLRVHRPVDHTLFFPSDGDRRAFLDEARSDGLEAQVRAYELEDTTSTHRFGVDLTWEHALLKGVVDPYVVGLSRRAARFGGVYDGWGSLVVGAKDR
jgi:regulator of RNase E activity RraB